jgi:hypothetical protein
MGIKITNFADSTLTTTIVAGDTSLIVASGDGAKFPTLTGSDYFYCVLQDNLNNFEVVKVTARSTDTFTIVRAQEGTTARGFTSAVTAVSLRITAQTFLDIAYSTTDTSATSNVIGTGAKTFTVTSGKNFVGGMYLVIADNAAPSTNSMYGQVTSYSGTSLVMNITAVLGSGTKTSWLVSQASPGGFGSYAAAGANNDITSLGALSTAITAPQGGTGQTVYTVGDVLYANTTTTLTKLNAGTAGQVLTANGAGTAPSWQTASSASFAATTRMPFNQASAPTGWTQDTSAGLNDSILRIVNGTGGGSGGSTAFSAFNGQTVTAAYTLAIADMPSHTHGVGAGVDFAMVQTGSGNNSITFTPGKGGGSVSSAVGFATATGAQGGNGGHSHGITTAIKYNDFIIASKN